MKVGTISSYEFIISRLIFLWYISDVLEKIERENQFLKENLVKEFNSLNYGNVK